VLNSLYIFVLVS